MAFATRAKALQNDIRSTDVAALALALAFGALGGLAAQALGLPLPFLLGGLLVTATIAILQVDVLGRTPAIPNWFRSLFVPIIGVAIGATVTPDLLDSLARWWPSLLAVCLYIPLAHLIGYQIARRFGRIDAPTAYFGSAPGGLIEAVVMGERAGGDLATLTTLQFLRLILCIVLIPLGFWLATGTQVGSAGGAVLGESADPLTVRDWIVLGLCAAAGLAIGRGLMLPAGIITGPLILSGAAHLLGWVQGAPPGWLIAVTQLVIGASLGGRFAGQDRRRLARTALTSFVTVSALLLLAGALASPLARLVGESWQAVFLAFAPGGLAEMVLIALSLEISVIYVTAHHILRILMAVGGAAAFSTRVLGPSPEP